jgi:hypothetical protein
MNATIAARRFAICAVRAAFFSFAKAAMKNAKDARKNENANHPFKRQSGTAL